MSLAGQVALVTGGGSGIGRACAIAFAEQGAKVAVLDRDATASEGVAAEIGSAAMACVLDVTDAAVVGPTLDLIEVTLGPVDHLVNSAGIRDIASCLDLTPELWNAVIGVNLTGPFLWSQGVARRLVARGAGGSITGIASVAGLTGFAQRSAYTSSKHGLVGLTKVLALELGEHGVRVNAIAPGGVLTPMSAEALRNVPDAEASVKRLSPMGRMADPSEVASLAVYLASDAARFVTGTVIPFDGGAMAGRVL